jgi:hypothetical protein
MNPREARTQTQIAIGNLVMLSGTQAAGLRPLPPTRRSTKHPYEQRGLAAVEVNELQAWFGPRLAQSPCSIASALFSKLPRVFISSRENVAGATRVGCRINAR